MSETESFESVMEAAMPLLSGDCVFESCPDEHDDCMHCAIYMADRLRRAHDREIRDVTQQEYHRGYEDGQHSMDAEHRVIAMRLRGLRFDGGSHENLSRIAYAIYPCATGWTCESADGLRDKLIDLMGGVSDGTAEPMTTDEFIEFIEEDTRRLKADGTMEVSNDTCDSQCRGACADCDGGDSGEQEEVGHGGAADDCGADTSCGGCGGDLHMAGVSITDELRKWASDRHCKGISHTDVLNIGLIADRIDEQFDRICQQQEAVLQEAIDGMVELPRDKDGEVFRVDGGAKVDDLVLTIRQMTLTRSGWKIRAYDEDYEVEREASFFDACAPKPDLIEEIIEKLTLGEITQTEAIERIKSLGQE